ncbi:MAG: septum formation initiator family protein [Alphaproteobacteria bacterium]
MPIVHELRHRARHIIPQVIGACVFAYLVFHTFQGDRGLANWLRLSQEVENTRATAIALASERQILARRVRLLRPDSLDPDLLEERAKIMAGQVRPDEVVILLTE